MAEWLGKGLQNLVQRFESASDLTETALQLSTTRFYLNCHTFVIPTFIRGWFLQYKITSYRYPDEFGGLLDSFYHLILAIVFGLHLV